MNFWQWLFCDQSHELDEKRVMGVPTFTLGVLFGFIGGCYAVFSGKPDLVGPVIAVSGFLTGAGITALGIAVAGDQGKQGAPGASDQGGG